MNETNDESLSLVNFCSQLSLSFLLSTKISPSISIPLLETLTSRESPVKSFENKLVIIKLLITELEEISISSKFIFDFKGNLKLTLELARADTLLI